ncbi:bacterial Ig-like domain-containing protein [Lactococcus lactis]|uniref:Bacterial Ig-like domain-containing protein n=1 Tax=Lactococcus lactis TaxID=1358 RepID=A0AAP4DV37_9LACT|nr:bacterial Ig-like domain-containing protein [Lactococcus lactis]MDG4977598.1 bacterial Ig-like domain-containing protein [Lactococcus lactis]
MKKKFLKKYSIILCAGVVIISALELSGNVGNHASAEMISQNVTDTGFTTVSGTVNTKPVITAGGFTGSKTVSGTAAPGATVDLYATSGKMTVTADEKGNWTANLTTGLTAGTIYAWSALNGQNWIESDQVTVEVPKPPVSHRFQGTTASNVKDLEAKDIVIHTGDSWDAPDNITSIKYENGNTFNRGTTANINHLGTDVDVTTSHTTGILANGKALKAGNFSTTYWFGTPEKSVTAGITVLPVVGITAKDTTIYQYYQWSPENSFTSATADGAPVDFSKITVTGSFDTTKPGVYPITYTYLDKSTTVNLTVKADQSALAVRDLTLHVGGSWNEFDNITSYTDRDGGHHSWDNANADNIFQELSGWSYVGDPQYSLGFAPGSDPLLSNGKFVKPGKFTVTYEFGSRRWLRNPKATVTVLP